MERIRICIVGIGNCASALIQGIQYYRGSNKKGLVHPTFAGYRVSDIQLVAAVDISENKVGKNVLEAIKENDLQVVIDHLGDLNVPVSMGKILDGIINETEKNINPSNKTPVDIADLLKSTKAEIVLCLLPSGADEAV